MTINRDYLYTEKARARGVSHYDYHEIIQSVIQEIPELTADGCGVLEDRKAEFEASQKLLFSESSEDAFWACCEYIQFLRPTKNISANYPTSYHWKTKAENWADFPVYVPNGIFIAAAIHSGLQFKRIKESVNLLFNLNDRSGKCRQCGYDFRGGSAHV